MRRRKTGAAAATGGLSALPSAAKERGTKTGPALPPGSRPAAGRPGRPPRKSSRSCPNKTAEPASAFGKYGFLQILRLKNPKSDKMILCRPAFYGIIASTEPSALPAPQGRRPCLRTRPCEGGSGPLTPRHRTGRRCRSDPAPPGPLIIDGQTGPAGPAKEFSCLIYPFFNFSPRPTLPCC